MRCLAPKFNLAGRLANLAGWLDSFGWLADWFWLTGSGWLSVSGWPTLVGWLWLAGWLWLDGSGSLADSGWMALARWPTLAGWLWLDGWLWLADWLVRFGWLIDSLWLVGWLTARPPDHLHARLTLDFSFNHFWNSLSPSCLWSKFLGFNRCHSKCLRNKNTQWYSYSASFKNQTEIMIDLLHWWTNLKLIISLAITKI